MMGNKVGKSCKTYIIKEFFLTSLRFQLLKLRFASCIENPYGFLENVKMYPIDSIFSSSSLNSKFKFFFIGLKVAFI